MQDKLTTKTLDSFIYSIGGNDFNKYVTSSTYQVLSKYYYGESCLELGSADGYGTTFLLKRFKKVVAVDGSKRMLNNLRKKVKSKKLQVIHTLFEDLNLKGKFDTIVITHVIDIVDNPIQVLKIAKSFAHKKTRIIIEVPNSHSLHRQIGVLLKILKDEHQLGEADKNVGHQRIYDMKILLSDIKKSGLKIKAKGGFLLKALPNSQIYSLIDNNPKAIQAYIELGEKYPDIAAEIYVVCSI